MTRLEVIRRAREHAFYVSEQAKNLDLMWHYYQNEEYDAAMYYHLMLLFTYDEVSPTWQTWLGGSNKDSMCFYKLLNWSLHEADKQI